MELILGLMTGFHMGHLRVRDRGLGALVRQIGPVDRRYGRLAGGILLELHAADHGGPVLARGASYLRPTM